MHVELEDNSKADALSRRPKAAAATLATARATLRLMDDRIREETDKSGSMKKLKALIKNIFPATKQEMDDHDTSTGW